MNRDDIGDLVLVGWVLFLLWLRLEPRTISRLWNRRKLIWRTLREELRHRD